jgi:hypothetical protein
MDSIIEIKKENGFSNVRFWVNVLV